MKTYLIILLVAWSGTVRTAEVTGCEGAVSITDHDIETLYSQMWAHLLEYGDGWLVIPRSGKTGIPVYALTKDLGLRRVIEPDLRLGLQHVQGAAVHPNGTLVVAGYFNPHLFSADLTAGQPRLVRGIAMNGLMGTPFFFEEDRIAGGNQKLKLFLGDGKTHSVIAKINARLERDRFHPITRESNFHRIHAIRAGNTIAMGYTLSDFLDVFIIDNDRVSHTKVQVAFRGFQVFPKTWQKGVSGNQEKYVEAMKQGHHLLGLSTDGQAIYGLFRLGFTDDLSFARLHPNREFLYRNKGSERQLFAIGQRSNLVGHRHESPDGEVRLCVTLTPPLTL